MPHMSILKQRLYFVSNDGNGAVGKLGADASNDRLNGSHVLNSRNAII